MLLLSIAPFVNYSISIPIIPLPPPIPTTFISTISTSRIRIRIRIRISSSRSPIGFNTRAFVNKPSPPSLPKDTINQQLSSSSVIHTSSLRVLDWDKVSDSVASFAGTSFGKQSTKAQLWNLNRTYGESLRLLDETNAAVQMHNYGGCIMDFSGLDLELVKSAIRQARRHLPMDGSEAMALVALLQFAESLQFNLKSAIQEDADWLQRFMPIAELIMELVINRSLVKFILQLIDADGSVKDSASSILKQSRDQVRLLERKLYQLMERLVRNEMNETPSLEVSNVAGRWCIQSGTDLQPSFEGLLLSSGSGSGSIVEPLSAVPLNDELQQARLAVAQAETDVLLKITEKMQVDLDDIENLFNNMILLDVINARAKYSLSFGGTYPDLFLPEDNDSCLTAEALSGEKTSTASHPTQSKWKLYLPKVYHPLLLQQHREALQKAMKNVDNATSDIRRRKQQGQNMTQKEEADASLLSLQMQVAKLKQAPPVPVDIFVAQKTRVLVITGPNAGGKTICLKTLGLAAMMAKSGVYVLSSEPVKIPWFDSVFADIGDEQSLSQSLSTFSGHLKQTSEILSHSTSRSLVLLDEVGAGTNPLEGAALGMSLLESFAEAGAFLTIATTHHGELKTLKYSNDVFENASMEFDEVNLKPTYKILWGVPGRSNAISIAARLGLPDTILNNARELYGAASAEINEVIVEMERFKQNFHEHISQAQHYLKLSRDLHENLLVARRKVMEHGTNQRYRKIREISELAATARSILHKKVRQLRASVAQSSRSNATTDCSQQSLVATNIQHNTTVDNSQIPVTTKTANSTDTIRNPASGGWVKIPKIGDMVHVSSLNKKVTVLKVEPSKEEIVVQAGNMKLKLKLVDVVT
ncbi:hypothetical protein LguiA_024266 [Lonicera macranthoides]